MTSVTHAAAEPVKSEVMIAERTNPAVQLIVTSYTATVSARPTYYTNAGLALVERAEQKYIHLELASLSDIVAYVFERIEQNPTYYLREVGDPRSKTLRNYSYGTGWFADPAGYLVTAKHVVTADDGVKEGFAAQGVKEFATQDAKEWIYTYRKWDLSNEAKYYVQSAVTAFYAEKLRLRVSAPKASVILGTAAADGSRIGKAYPAEIVYRSSSDLGEDVAVLRIRAQGQLPSLRLASTPAVQGDQTYINAFPALPDDSEAAALQPTLTQGQITAIKPNRGGLQLLQTNATASQGASGGPAINPAGEVIGILVSGAVDESGDRLGQNYLMPLDSVRSALTRSGAAPDPGQTTTLYNEALDLFYGDHFQASLDKFRQVKDLFPAHAYVGGYIARAQLAISQGKDVPVVPPEPPGLNIPWMWILIGTGAVLLVATSAALGYGISRHSRRKAGRAAELTGSEAWQMQPHAGARGYGLGQMNQNPTANMGFGSAHAPEYHTADSTAGAENTVDQDTAYPKTRPTAHPNN